MKSYLDIVNQILTTGTWKSNRTGIDTIGIIGVMFEHDMSTGFPLLTTKKMAQHTMAVELEGFIGGVTDKRWYQNRHCHIWDQWCNPQAVPYATNPETKQLMVLERDLGPIYGFQWRDFGAHYCNVNYVTDKNGKPGAGNIGVDQLKMLVDTLKTNSDCRRMIVSAWNPAQLHQMALPPCHWGFQIVLDGDKKLNLLWNQRSVDTMLGLPFNIASYGLLLHLLALESGFEAGKLIGFLADTHIYRNQVKLARKQLARTPHPLPTVKTYGFDTIFNWTHPQTTFLGYTHDKSISFPLAV